MDFTSILMKVCGTPLQRLRLARCQEHCGEHGAGWGCGFEQEVHCERFFPGDQEKVLLLQELVGTGVAAGWLHRKPINSSKRRTRVPKIRNHVNIIFNKLDMVNMQSANN